MKKEKRIDFESRAFALWFALLAFVQGVVSFLLGGERCVCCSARALRVPLCRRCIPRLWEAAPSRVCECCGRELVSEIGLCSRCREEPVFQHVDGAISLHGYQLWKKSLLFAWKLGDRRNLSPYFAAIFCRRLRSLEQSLGMRLCVVPVPPRSGKIRERGWDQMEELCYYLERGWHVRVLRLLERLSSVQQKKLNRAQRIEGIGSSYRLASARKIRRILPAVPESVVLADDVMTTGSTLESCARELKKLGIRRVFAITLFAVQ